MVRATPRFVLIALCTLLAVEGAAAATCTINQYVRSNVCTTCPTGYARAAGDDSTGADTACLLCAEGFYVSAKGADANTAGTCTACTAGSLTSSLTDSTSAGTALTASSCTQCAADHHVSALGAAGGVTAGTCTSCPSGKIAAGSDSTSAGALNRCTLKTCAVNQYVKHNFCMDCPTGYTNGADDPSTGADTHCTKCADGYFVSAKGSSTTTPGTCTPCGTGFDTTGAESHSGVNANTVFADANTGCLKTAPGYYLTAKGTTANDATTAVGSTVAACPTGYTTDGGANAAGDANANTVFTDATTGCLKTAANYYVSAVGTDANTAGTVTACPSGSTNAAGDTSVGGASGVLSECDTAAKVMSGAKCADAAYGLVNAGCTACAANNYVAAKGADVITAGTCTVCAAGTTNAAGDVSTTSTTTCDTTVCAANEYVSSNACTACATGTTNAAGDAATGANTACDKTTCAADQYVKSNVCTECEGTSINEAGDDASGADTECDLVSVSGASHSVVKATTMISFLVFGFLALAM